MNFFGLHISIEQIINLILLSQGLIKSRARATAFDPAVKIGGHPGLNESRHVISNNVAL